MDDEQWMAQALSRAHQAAAAGEVPVGAVLVGSDNQLLASGWNQPISACDPTAHAEIVALRAAAQECNNYRFPGTTLYVTVEPCTMCVGAIIHGRVSRVVIGAREPKAGAVVSQCRLLDADFYNHRVDYTLDVLASEASDLMSAFFRERRGHSSG